MQNSSSPTPSVLKIGKLRPRKLWKDNFDKCTLVENLGRKGRSWYTLGSLSIKRENLTYIFEKGPCMGGGRGGREHNPVYRQTQDKEITFHMKGSVGEWDVMGHAEKCPWRRTCWWSLLPWDQLKTKTRVWFIFVALGFIPGPHWHRTEAQQSTSLGETLLTAETTEAETRSPPGGKHGLSRRRMFQEATASVSLTLREFSSLSLRKHG